MALNSVKIVFFILWLPIGIKPLFCIFSVIFLKKIDLSLFNWKEAYMCKSICYAKDEFLSRAGGAHMSEKPN